MRKLPIHYIENVKHDGVNDWLNVESDKCGSVSEIFTLKSVTSAILTLFLVQFSNCIKCVPIKRCKHACLSMYLYLFICSYIDPLALVIRHTLRYFRIWIIFFSLYFENHCLHLNSDRKSSTRNNTKIYWNLCGFRMRN